MADILKKIKDWDFTNKDSNVSLSLEYTELAEISDIVNRKIWLTSEFEDYTVNSVIYTILSYNAQDKGIPVEKRKPIILYISCVGGNSYNAWGLISAIETSITPVYTVVTSYALSNALVASVVGVKRYCFPNSIYLMHDGSIAAIDSTNKVRDLISFETGAMEDRYKNIILNHTSLTKKQYDEKYRKEWYFFPEEAKKYGFVDFVIGQDCNIDEII